MSSGTPPSGAPSSDYGSDLDTDGEETVHALLEALDANPINSLALESLVEDDKSSISVVHVPKSSQGSGNTAYFSALEGQSERRPSSSIGVNNRRISGLSETEPGMWKVLFVRMPTDELTASSCIVQECDGRDSGRRCS